MKQNCVLIFAFVLMAETINGSPARIDIAQIKESFTKEDGITTKVRIGITTKTRYSVLEINYQGQINKTSLSNRRVRLDKFRNKDGTIIGFNFRSGVQINEIYLVVATSNSAKIMDKVGEQLVEQLHKEGIDIRSTELYLDAIRNNTITVYHENAGSAEGWFSFKASVADGRVQIIHDTLHNWNLKPTD